VLKPTHHSRVLGHCFPVVGRMKKHGGPLPGWGCPPPYDHARGRISTDMPWGADGTPFARVSYVPAVYEPLDGVEEKPTVAAPPTELPLHVLAQLARALRARDSAAFSRAMEKLEVFDPKDQDYDKRVKLFMDGLQDILMNPNLMREGGAAFVLEAIDAKLREQSSPGRTDPAAPYKGAEVLPRRDVGRRMFRSDHEMADASCAVLQPPSHLAEWESHAAFGHHPGVLFGSHCHSVTAHGIPELTWGEGAQWDPEISDWYARYPNAAVAHLFEDR